MVDVGETLIDPLRSTEPIPWLIIMVSAPLELQVSMLDPPWVIGFGEAEMLTSGGWLTMMVISEVLEPYAFVAVIVYVVVVVGDTTVDPFKATAPIPWSISTLSVRKVVHVSVDDSPEEILLGSAVMLTTGRLFTVTVTVVVVEPYALLAVIVYAVVTTGSTLVLPLAATAPIP